VHKALGLIPTTTKKKKGKEWKGKEKSSNTKECDKKESNPTYEY
jgi:hypothetical protein